MSDTFEFPLPDQNAGGNLPVNTPIAAPMTARMRVSQAGHAGHHAEPSASLPAPRADLRARICCQRSMDVTDGGPDEVSTTLDVSRGGVLFASNSAAFEVAMNQVASLHVPLQQVTRGVQAKPSYNRVARVTYIECAGWAPCRGRDVQIRRRRND